MYVCTYIYTYTNIDKTCKVNTQNWYDSKIDSGETSMHTKVEIKYTYKRWAESDVEYEPNWPYTRDSANSTQDRRRWPTQPRFIPDDGEHRIMLGWMPRWWAENAGSIRHQKDFHTQNKDWGEADILRDTTISETTIAPIKIKVL